MRVLLWMMMFAAVPSAALAANKPNIIFILSDDQGWNASSVQMDPDIPESKSDYYQTPNLETLAARGMRFSSAYAASACSMTRAAIQTGKSPAALQFTDVIAAANPRPDRYEVLFTGNLLAAPLIAPKVADSETMIPEWLDQSNSGYRTAHVGKWHIGDSTHSYDYNSFGSAPGPDAKNIFRYTNGATTFMQQEVAADRPFFLQLSHEAPHEPVQYLQETYQKWLSVPPGTRHSDPRYGAMIEDLDTGIGQILAEVDRLGIRDNTYIIFGSDNGAIAQLGTQHNAPLYNSKGSVYEGGVRVPLIIAGPGITPGSVSDVPVQLQDLFATVADIADTPPVESDVESASLLPVLHNNGQLPGGAPLSRGYAPNGELFIHAPHYIDGITRVPASAIRDGDYKLVKVYGANGQPDKVMLFNLAANIAESADPNSPLNLANAMPQKTAQMLAKLDQWLQDVDASQAYDISEDVGLHWMAAQRGSDPTAWRSVNDVDSYFRERWQSTEAASQPTLVTGPTIPAEVGGAAFRFDGNDALTHEFFRASDFRLPGVGDFDRSASLVMSFRTSTLAQNQVLFESGDGNAGISLTLGDGDGDGSRDELRFRVLGANLQDITATISLADLANPMQEFVEAAAVFSDNPADRYVELYIDGVLAKRVDGLGGSSNSYQWDRHNVAWIGFQHAGMGGAVGGGANGGAGNGLGANGGTGDLPFAGNFMGDIASLSFYNYVINPLQITPDADFNGDGFVNAQDLIAWRGAIGVGVGGDADGDGDTDGRDFLVWQRQLGSPPATTTSHTIPEPAAFAMVAVLGGATAVGRRRLV